jgi:ribosomal protein S27AE
LAGIGFLLIIMISTYYLAYRSQSTASNPKTHTKPQLNPDVRTLYEKPSEKQLKMNNFCVKCGSKLTKESVYCGVCGSKVPTREN